MQEVRRNSLYFGGVFVIYLGDFLQLPPAVGTSLMKLIVDLSSPAGGLIRPCKKLVFTIQQRAAEDVVHTQLLQRIANPILYPIIFSDDLLRPSCHHCRNGYSPLCSHLRVLTEEIVNSDESWSTAPIITGTNEAANKYNIVRMQSFAAKQGLPVFRWRLPAISTGDNPQIYNAISDEMAFKYFNLWGWFVYNLPIKVDYNVSLAGRIINGTKGTCSEIRPENPLQMQNMINDGNFIPGDIITINPPFSITLAFNSELFPSVPFVVHDNVTFARRKEVILGQDSIGSANINVIRSGIYFFFYLFSFHFFY